MLVNGLGIPSASGAEVPDHPESMLHPVWKGFGWVSDESAYIMQAEYEQQQSLLQRREAAKQARAAAVDAIKVTISTGKTFDGYEDAQARMTRAVIGLQAAGIPAIPWTLADNTIELVTLAELTEAMILAGTQQSQLWALDQYMN
jgi:hypothetical protein